MSGVRATLSCILLLIAFSVLPLGCGPLPQVPVSGRVTLDGEPLPGAHVTFQPAEGGRGSYGLTDDRGVFQLKTMVRGRSGAISGWHNVMISTDTEVDEAAIEKGSIDYVTGGGNQKVPVRYLNGEEPLTCNVPPGGTANADFELTSSSPDNR